MGRVLLLATCLTCAASGVVAAAGTSDAVMQAKRSAYALAQQCFVADGVARGYDLHVGDKPRAAELEKRARTAFDAATNLGRELGYSGTRVNQDTGLVQSQEIPKYYGDINYLRTQIAQCANAGI